MGKKSKEEQQRQLEESYRLKEKQMLQLKASNEMLELAKQGIINKYGADSDTGKDLLQQIETAQNQNTERAMTYLGVTKEDMEAGKYKEVNPKEAEAYYTRLKRLNKSDELIHMKNVEDQLKVYEETNSVSKAKPKKMQSKLSELTEKLNKLKNYNMETFSTDEVETQNLPENPFTPHTDVKEIETKQSTNEMQKTVNVEIQQYSSETFDPRTVPSYVQYDMIPLPSKGECYPNKMKSIPVAYLTAADENLITSRNMYENGSMIDIILERKILDKSIRVKDLCKGDRDAIAIWLRATAYGPDYPVVAIHEGEEISTVIDLNNIQYLDFDLTGDENGWFTYTTEADIDGNCDTLKFKVLTHDEEESILEDNNKTGELIHRNTIIQNINNSILSAQLIPTKETDEIVETMEIIKKWASNYHGEKLPQNGEELYSTYITDRMFKQTMSINGNTDREFIKNYIMNMRAKQAFNYRQYMLSNTPGVNLQIEIPIPESLGGGSFTTFLPIGERIFINVL